MPLFDERLLWRWRRCLLRLLILRRRRRFWSDSFSFVVVEYLLVCLLELLFEDCFLTALFVTELVRFLLLDTAWCCFLLNDELDDFFLDSFFDFFFLLFDSFFCSSLIDNWAVLAAIKLTELLCILLILFSASEDMRLLDVLYFWSWWIYCCGCSDCSKLLNFFVFLFAESDEVNSFFTSSPYLLLLLLL